MADESNTSIWKKARNKKHCKTSLIKRKLYEKRRKELVKSDLAVKRKRKGVIKMKIDLSQGILVLTTVFLNLNKCRSWPQFNNIKRDINLYIKT
jgi:hypothetical protein